MLPETLCAGDATSPGPLIPSEVTTSIPLRLEPWTLVQIITAPNIIDNLSTIPSFPPVSTHYHTLRLPQYYPLIIPCDCYFPSCFFFLLYSRYSREILRPVIYHDNQTIHTNPREAATGADVKGVERLCRVETSERVSRTLVTVPLPPPSSWHGFLRLKCWSWVTMCWCGDVPNVSGVSCEKKSRYVCGFVIVV